MTNRYPRHLLQLIEALKRLPGVGNKSAERFAFQMLDWKKEYLHELAHLINEVPVRIKSCEECGCLVGGELCLLCGEKRGEQKVLCLVASPKDVFAFEETGEYKGLYHVLGTLLSPLEGRGTDRLPMEKVLGRIEKHGIQEVVMALDSTLEGDATALYLKRELQEYGKNFGQPLHISRLALGLPMGSSLDYIDGGTLARAFSGRLSF